MGCVVQGENRSQFRPLYFLYVAVVEGPMPCRPCRPPYIPNLQLQGLVMQARKSPTYDKVTSYSLSQELVQKALEFRNLPT